MRFRECLMQIGMLCEENSMENFVENLCDLTKLIDEMSPTIVTFFENSFNETRFTKRISNIDWHQGKKCQVIPKPKSILTAQAANLALNKGVKAEDSDKIQNRLVFTKMLQIGWVYENPEGDSASGFRELVIALSDAPNESLFSTELVEIMCCYFLQRYKDAIRIRVFLPWLLYFFLVIFYMSYFAVVGSQNLEGQEKVIEMICKTCIIILAMYFEFFEVISFIRDWRSYAQDYFNVIDLFSPINNIYCMVHSGEEDRSTIKILAALAVCFMWIKAFYWMRMSIYTAEYVRLLAETLKGVKWFLIPFVCILILFADAFMILNE